MRKFLKVCGVGLLIVLLASGCAKTPDISVNYFLPKSDLQLKVFRTVACDAAKNPVVASTVMPTVSHVADMDTPKSIKVAELDGFLSNSNLEFEFYEDGRLKGINTTSTGQGEPILKSAISLVASALSHGIMMAPAPVPNGTTENNGEEGPCDYIQKTAQGKVRTLAKIDH